MADLYGLPTIVVTHQLQVERGTGKVRRPETDVLPLSYATNQAVVRRGYCRRSAKLPTFPYPTGLPRYSDFTVVLAAMALLLIQATLKNLCDDDDDDDDDERHAGVCMWEIMGYGVKPWPELQNSEVIEVVERGERLSRPSSCPLGVYNLMADCWIYRASQRPSFAVVKARLRYDV